MHPLKKETPGKLRTPETLPTDSAAPLRQPTTLFIMVSRTNLSVDPLVTAPYIHDRHPGDTYSPLEKHVMGRRPRPLVRSSRTNPEKTTRSRAVFALRAGARPRTVLGLPHSV